MSSSNTRPISWQESSLFCLFVCLGIGFGFLTGANTANTILRVIYYGSMLGYTVVALTDLVEHVKLEKTLTGSYFSTKAISLRESFLHVLIVGVVVSFLWLAQPLHAVFGWRDWFLLSAPGLFFFFAWMDELIYHQSRTKQRENILHTLSHTAAVTMLMSCILLRVMGI